MPASQLQHFGRCGLLAAKTGNAILDLVTGFVDLPLTHPEDLAFEAIHLTEAGPIGIIIQHFTGLQHTDFDPTMTITDLFRAQEVGFDLAEARFGWLRRE